MTESRVEKNHEIIEELEDEERKKKNKKMFKILLWIFLPLFIIFTISYTCLRYIGNIGIMVREYPVYNSKIDKEFNGIKIVQFSDIHFSKHSSVDTIKSLVSLINKANPDIVIFTGDLIDKDYNIKSEEKEAIMSEFKNIKSSLGKYAIKGEEDNQDFKDIFDNSNFIILDNQIEKININASSINIIAVDETYTTEQVVVDNNNFSIAVVHKPDLADRINQELKPDIIIAGHSHNGQVILPIFGAAMKKEGAKKYYSSYYELGDTKLFISGGIGNSKYQFRLFNHPSFNLYRLRTNK